MTKTSRIFSSIVIAAVAVAGFSGSRHSESRAASPVRLADDLYPLYRGVSWSDAVPATIEDLSGYQATASAATDTTDIGAVATPFVAYYDKKLTAAGWTQDLSRVADGPGDSITPYTKGDSFIVISYTSDFKVSKPDEADQCPCDVTFSVFSGVLAPTR